MQNKLVLTWLVCLLAVSLSIVDTKSSNATTLYGATTEYEYQKAKDKDKEHKDNKDKDNHEWEYEEKDKHGAPVPFELSPTTGALALVGWGVFYTSRKRKKVRVTV